jgi:hypothetical protein
MVEHTQPALYALARLHAELGGRIQENKREAVRLRADMVHVERVLKLLEPEYDTRTIAARRKFQTNPVFRRKKLFGSIVGVLKESLLPMTAQEIAAILLERHYKNGLTKVQQHNLRTNIIKAIKRYPEAIAGDGQRPERWRLTPLA